MPDSQALMAGKRGLVMGVANDRSIAWGIASSLHAHGAELAFTYQGEALEKRVRPLAESVGSNLMVPCDVTEDESIDAAFATLKESWDSLDFVVHAIAYSDKEELKGKYLNTSRDNFVRSLDISCYSFTGVAQRAVPMMNGGGSLLTLTYYGAERVMPHYNVMGVAKAALEASVRYLAADLGDSDIRVNAISAGPIATRAAGGLTGFDRLLEQSQALAPLTRKLGIDDVGGSAAFLLLEAAAAITGEVIHVDCGGHACGPGG